MSLEINFLAHFYVLKILTLIYGIFCTYYVCWSYMNFPFFLQLSITWPLDPPSFLECYKQNSIRTSSVVPTLGLRQLPLRIASSLGNVGHHPLQNTKLTTPPIFTPEFENFTNVDPELSSHRKTEYVRHNHWTSCWHITFVEYYIAQWRGR